MRSLNTGISPPITLRIPQELLDRMDPWMQETGESRSEFIRNAIEVMVNEYEQSGVQW